MPVLHPSGGLVYHLRAWRHCATLWAPFHVQVRAWLADWRPAATHLVLLGPSGGYALDTAFLARMPRITVLEPDPLARAILRRRFPGTAFRFAPGEGLGRPDGLQRLAAACPDAAFLFCNLLGQRLVGQGEARQDWLAGLPAALAGRAWASWHDLASTHRPPDVAEPFTLPRAEPLDEVLAHAWHGGELIIHDHETAGLLPDAPRRHALWTLSPGHYHLVEWLHSA
ncbi:MAG: hypothetical protein AB1831_04350 [Pseudomonadota bacterium]